MYFISFCTGKVNIVVPHCKLHNSASAHISQDNTLLATFVPNHHGFPDNNILAVYSLLPETRGQCLYTKQFGKQVYGQLCFSAVNPATLLFFRL